MSVHFFGDAEEWDGERGREAVRCGLCCRAIGALGICKEVSASRAVWSGVFQ